MASSMFSLPATIRLLIFSRYLALRKSPTFGRDLFKHQEPLSHLHRRKYATIYANEKDDIWSSHGRSATSEKDDDLPTTTQIFKTARTVLEAHSAISDSERHAILNGLRQKVPNSTSGKRNFRRRLHAALDSKDQPDFASIITKAATGITPLQLHLKLDEKDWEDLLIPQPPHDRKDKPGRMHTLCDLGHIQRHMPLPVPGDYPKKWMTHLDAEGAPGLLLQLWNHKMRVSQPIRRGDISSKYFKDWSDLGRSMKAHAVPGTWACVVKAVLPGDIHVTGAAAGLGKQAATAAAWLRIISNLHQDGTLRQLISGPKTQNLVSAGNSTNSTEAAIPAPLPHDEMNSNEAGEDAPVPAAVSSSTEKEDAHSQETLSITEEPIALPTSKDYPTAPATLFRLPEGWRSVFAKACTKIGWSCKIKDELVSKAEGKKAYELRVEVAGIFTCNMTGQIRHDRALVNRAMLEKLHTTGTLRRLFPNVIDEQYVQEHAQLPTKDQYPGAPAKLFDPETVSQAFNETFQAREISYKLEVIVHKRGDDLSRRELVLDIEGIGIQKAEGDGNTVKLAKRNAWYHMLAKLHSSGILGQICPDGMETPRTKTGEGDPDPNHYEESELVNLDGQTLRNEKNAKLEIYNYAASIGQVPIFEAVPVQQTRRQRNSRKKSAVRATVRLPELDLTVSRVGIDLNMAETAAAIAFKEKAEERLSVDASKAVVSQMSLLSVETAPAFFAMYKKTRRGVSLELESEAVPFAARTRNSVRVLLNDTPIGESVSMPAKKDAEAVAYLVAAVEIAKAEPGVLQDFAVAMDQGNGKILQDVRPLDAMMNTSSLQMMRQTLIDVRRAGLPDARETPQAEEVHSSEGRRRNRDISESARNAASERLLKSQQMFEHDESLKELRETKAALPMSQYSAQVLDQVANNLYSIILGATGSGKTTQVPQILLDDAIRRGQGGFCDIICTQPRRLAASSVARRVAAERNEELAASVGYQVRFDAKVPRNGGSITYCTTGILLEQLKHDADAILDNTSHVIIDEVHERDLQIDFLMIILKKAIQARLDAEKPVPKVILMSATLDENLFANYFARETNDRRIPCPSLSVPGRTYPVQEVYLEDIMSEINKSHKRDLTDLMALDEPTSKDYLAAETSFANINTGTTTGSSLIDWKRERVEKTEEETQLATKEKEDALVPKSLIAATIAHICRTSGEGAIITFLPGLQEITEVHQLLLQQPIFGLDFNDMQKFKFCLLHSTVPPEEQRKVLEPVPQGCRKIILSTNIAETSITVPDVKYVIDPGKMREKQYDQVRKITKLQCVWESNSNARQRAGRAGRVRDGYYYALYTRERRQAMSASGAPELLRSDLQETCLSIKAQGFKEPVADFLALSIEPPREKAVEVAVRNLQAIGAFTQEEQLTSLGRILSKLPVHPSLGKMVLLGIIFRCLDPMIVLSSMNSERSLFVNPLSGRDAARKFHETYNQENSDHLAQYSAFKELRAAKERFGDGMARRIAQDKYLHMGVFRTAASTAEQIEGILADSGLLPSISTNRHSQTGYGGKALNINSDNAALVKCLLLAGVHPNLGAGTRRLGRAHRTPTESGALLHPSSLNYERRLTDPERELYVYTTLAQSADGTTLFMRDCTRVAPLSAILFGGRLQLKGRSFLKMDDWLPIQILALGDSRHATQLILEYRKALDRMLFQAFHSLANGGSGEVQNTPQITEMFVTSLAELLSPSKQEGENWVPPSWRGQGNGAVRPVSS